MLSYWNLDALCYAFLECRLQSRPPVPSFKHTRPKRISETLRNQVKIEKNTRKRSISTHVIEMRSHEIGKPPKFSFTVLIEKISGGAYRKQCRSSKGERRGVKNEIQRTKWISTDCSPNRRVSESPQQWQFHNNEHSRVDVRRARSIKPFYSMVNVLNPSSIKFFYSA